MKISGGAKIGDCPKNLTLILLEKVFKFGVKEQT